MVIVQLSYIVICTGTVLPAIDEHEVNERCMKRKILSLPVPTSRPAFELYLLLTFSSAVTFDEPFDIPKRYYYSMRKQQFISFFAVQIPWYS